MNKKYKKWLWRLVVLGMLCVGVHYLLYAMKAIPQHSIHIATTLRLVSALGAYAEANGGCLPSDFEAYVKSGFASKDPKTPNLVYLHKKLNGHGLQIDNFHYYQILWGLTPDDFTIRDGKVIDKAGNEIFIISLSSEGISFFNTLEDKELSYRRNSQTIAKKMKETARNKKELTK